MEECTTDAIEFPAELSKDVLTEILREGARKMPATAIEVEVDAYIQQHADQRDANGHRLVVRNGHKNELPKGRQAKSKSMIHDIWMAETKAKAEKALDLFLETFEAKYPKATKCLAKDRDVLLTFYDFPAEHWVHIRTTNPIESTFATVRLRTRRTKGCGRYNRKLWMAE